MPTRAMLLVGRALGAVRRMLPLRRGASTSARDGDAWRASRVADDGTHHVDAAGTPLYAARFAAVLPFHSPGLAPAQLRPPATSWCHITPSGEALSAHRYQRTFGFYEQRAAVTVRAAASMRAVARDGR